MPLVRRTSLALVVALGLAVASSATVTAAGAADAGGDSEIGVTAKTVTIAVIAERRGDQIAVTVADEGPGIEPADQERIFEKYERIGDTPGGIGLGLAISRRLARSMGGDVVVQSAPGEGARFTLLLSAI